MQCYHKLSFLNKRETKVQTMQYKILTGIYPTRLKLFQWRITNSFICNYCEYFENIQHHFLNCDKTLCFWNSLYQWWIQFCTKCLSSSSKTILLGIIDRVCHKPHLNYVILKTKWYLYKTKYLKHEASFLDLWPYWKESLKTERSIA